VAVASHQRWARSRLAVSRGLTWKRTQTLRSHGRRAKTVLRRATEADMPLDMSMDLITRPQRRIVKELSKFEDPDDPQRPQAPPRNRRGLWAPPGPQALSAPEVLVVGLGRRQSENE
ncbi:unnamed protein product, partial [Polarella glacialis]